MISLILKSFFDPNTWTITHVVHCADTLDCAIIDSVLDYDQKAGRTATKSADALIEYILQNKLKVQWLLETHVHADHVTASKYLQSKLGGQIAIGSQVKVVQETFKKIFNAPDISGKGSEFDHLLEDGEFIKLGNLNIEVMHLPGHTPACVGYKVGQDVFVGDVIFMPEMGTGRCDFPGGSASNLYQSIKRLLALPESARLHVGHDYPPKGVSPRMLCTVDDQRKHNIHVHDGVDEATFVAMRESRDKNLAMPQLILPSLQFNARAGNPPPAEENGVSYLKIPLNVL